MCLIPVLFFQVTFFEILIGRTPFEESEDEQFSTTEQLSVYHDRTVQGKWLGEWSMSSGESRSTY